MTAANLTLHKLRSLYRKEWGRDWPHDDDLLRTLWLESREDHNQARARTPTRVVWDGCLLLMRENHDMEKEAS